MIKTLLENEIAKTELENNILVGTLKSKFIDIDIARKAVIDRLIASEGRYYPVVINIKAVKTITKDSRDFLASQKGCEGVDAAAIIITSYLGSMIGNFFLRVNKPLVPTKIFTDELEAKKWLRQFVK